MSQVKQLIFCTFAGSCIVELEFPKVESPLFISPSAPSPSSFPLLETPFSEPLFLFPSPTEKGKKQILQLENFSQAVACPGKRNSFSARKEKLEYLNCPADGSRRNKVTN